MEAIKTRSQLKKILAKVYPKMWIKDSEDFNGKKGSIWTGEGSYDNEGNSLFDYHAGGWDIQEKLYVLGIRKSLHNLLDGHGWYCEWLDGGTVFIYEK